MKDATVATGAATALLGLIFPGLANAHPGHGLDGLLAHTASHTGETLIFALCLAAIVSWALKKFKR